MYHDSSLLIFFRIKNRLESEASFLPLFPPAPFMLASASISSCDILCLLKNYSYFPMSVWCGVV